VYVDVLAEVLLQVHSNAVAVVVVACSEGGVMQHEHKLSPPAVSRWYDHVATANCGLQCLPHVPQPHCWTAYEAPMVDCYRVPHLTQAQISPPSLPSLVTSQAL
jgi:hypothetical protein